jgi:pimeloyl-ACP methyl ester carboxylesterase
MKRLVQTNYSLSLVLCSFSQSLTIRQFLLGNLYRPANEKVQRFKVPLRILSAALDNLGDFPFKDPEEVRFEKPALFVRGIRSKYVPDEVLPVIGKFFPMFQLVDIDAGHWVISEQPEAFRRGTSPFSRAKMILTLYCPAVVEFLQSRD